MAAIFGGHVEIILVYFHWVSTTMHAKFGLEISVRSLAIDIIEWFLLNTFPVVAAIFAAILNFFSEIFSNWVTTIVRAKLGTKKQRFIFQLDNLLTMAAI